ncbi:MAG: glycosyltransferase, partial [Acidiferrobacterales bacterium]
MSAQDQAALPRLPTVIHIMEGAIWAGAEVHLYHLATALARLQSVNLEIILLNHGTLEQRLTAQNIAVTIYDESSLTAISLFRRIFVHLIRKRPCIVHVHKQKESVLASLIALLLPNTICLRTVHGTYEPHIRRWQLRKHLARMTDLFCGRFLQQRIVSVSTELTTVLAASYPHNKIVTIENAIDIDHTLQQGALPIILPGPTDAIRVAIAGRFVPVKRIDIFLRTACQVVKSGEGDVFFFMLGDGPLETEMKSLAEKLDLGDRVFFLGFQNNAPAVLAKMHLLLMTSEHEGLPMTLLEALALGVPVIAHAVGGIPEILQHGRGGTLVEHNDPGEYARIIGDYIRNPETYTRKATLGERHAKQRYSVERMVNEYDVLYRQLWARSIL